MIQKTVKLFIKMKKIVFVLLLSLYFPLKAQISKCSPRLLITCGFTVGDTVVIKANNFILTQGFDSFGLYCCRLLGYGYFIPLPKGSQKVLVEYKNQKCSVNIYSCKKEIKVGLRKGKLWVKIKKKGRGYL